ncbi:hypothetical protein OIV83_000538 [Microbotryomycetes sp. JL201]|nr:hypothetical protein OIV83_000538 [Microbotryomycetes sp. JL201]
MVSAYDRLVSPAKHAKTDLITGFTLRVGIFTLHAIAPTAVVWTLVAACLWPVPPTVALATPLVRLVQAFVRRDHRQQLDNELVDFLFAYDGLSTALTAWFAVECVWLVIHWIGRKMVAQGVWDYQGTKEIIDAQERWRLFVKMAESHKDPWTWLHGFFALKKRAPRGIIDPCITKVKIEEVGQTNVKEFLAHFMFSKRLHRIKRDSLEAAELHAMVLLLEAALARTRPGFRFLRGRSRHHVMLLNDEPIRTSHHPLIFYACVWLASELGNAALWMYGFKYYGPKRTWPFPLFFMRGSRQALERLQDPDESKRMGDPQTANRVGYWYHPGSSKAQEEALTPIIFFHGISGTYGPTPFVLYLCWRTGRPCFMPELPYVAMRLSPPSAIRTRVEMVAACRRALWRHGFGATWEEEAGEGSSKDDGEEWRRGRAVIVGHSLGAGPCSWTLRDAPDIVAGVILLDPMSPLLYSSDTARNFFRTKCRTAGEIFFRYFASERGINHFLSRHIAWSDAVVFGPQPVAPLPDDLKRAIVPRFALTELEPPFDRPNYGQYVVPYPQGPFPTFVFLSENDCILPFKQQYEYLIGSGMTKESVKVMSGLEHAALLIRPHWGNEVAKCIDLVAEASEKWWWVDDSGVEQPLITAGVQDGFTNGHALLGKEDAVENEKRQRGDGEEVSDESHQVGNGHANVKEEPTDSDREPKVE